MKRLIINADDFGYSVGVNRGIIESYQHGILTSTTIMAGMSGFTHAVSLAQQNPGLGIGVHLTLTCGRPVLAGHKTLVLDDGSFPRKPFYLDETTAVDLDEVEREWTAQIERVLEAGIEPDHLDSHHHIHIFKGIEQVFYRLAHTYGLPVRNSWNDGGAYEGPERQLPQDIEGPEALIDFVKPARTPFIDDPNLYLERISSSFRQCVVRELKSHDVVEVMTHPAFVDFPLAAGSSFNIARTAETEVLCSDYNRAFIAGLSDVELTSYRALYASHAGERAELNCVA